MLIKRGALVMRRKNGINVDVEEGVSKILVRSYIFIIALDVLLVFFTWVSVGAESRSYLQARESWPFSL